MRVPFPRVTVLPLLVCPALLITDSCGPTSSADVLGTAYVAPATLNLRADLKQKATAGTLLKHGQRVDILDVRRRFVRVRAPGGEVGWVDSLQLLSPDQMAEVQRASN